MTIESEITRIKTNISNAYDALEEKGATIPSDKNSANLADTVATITGGGGETNYLGRTVTEDGVLQFPTEPFSFSLPSNVTSIGDNSLQYALWNCTNLTSVDLSSVTSIGESGLRQAFYGCTSLTSTGLDSVTSIDSAGLSFTFNNCTGLKSLSFPALNSNSFGSYTNQFNGMLDGVTGCTVHFPSNLESVISDWVDVTRGFGGTSTTVLFDLPATT